MTAHARYSWGSALIQWGALALVLLLHYEGVNVWPLGVLAVVAVFVVTIAYGIITGDIRPEAETMGRWTVDETGKITRVE